MSFVRPKDAFWLGVLMGLVVGLIAPYVLIMLWTYVFKPILLVLV